MDSTKLTMRQVQFVLNATCNGMRKLEWRLKLIFQSKCDYHEG